MGWKSQANKLRAIHPNLNKNEISGRVLGRDTFESSAAEPINRRYLFDLFCDGLSNYTIYYTDNKSRWQTPTKKKREKNLYSSTQIVKSHIIPAVLIIDQVKRIIIVVHSLHVRTYEVYRWGAIIILQVAKNENHLFL